MTQEMLSTDDKDMSTTLLAHVGPETSLSPSTIIPSPQMDLNLKTIRATFDNTTFSQLYQNLPEWEDIMDRFHDVTSFLQSLLTMPSLPSWISHMYNPPPDIEEDWVDLTPIYKKKRV
jgi:hypothetical protein